MTNHFFKDETGKRYGILLVVDRSRNNLYSNATWNCICDCGKRAVVTGVSLRRGDTKSCGCIARNRGNHTVVEAEVLAEKAQAMLESGLSRKEVAALLGVTMRTVDRYKKKRGVSAVRVAAVCTKSSKDRAYLKGDQLDQRDLAFALV